MGVMRFLVDPARVTTGWPDKSQASIVGIDGRSHPTRLEWDGSVLTCRRASYESGKLHLTWHVEGHGPLVVSTTSLKEREAPYHLLVELARGRLSEVRDQAAAWEQVRMVLPEDYCEAIRDSFQLFSQAASRQDEVSTASDLASRALTRACDASKLLMQAYVRQREMTQRPGFSSSPSLGCHVDTSLLEPKYRQALTSVCSMALIPIEWKTIEPREGTYCWESVEPLVSLCRHEGLFIKAGPLIDLGPGGLPDWLSAWSGDLLNLTAFVCDFVETAITRFQGLVRIWEVSAYGNSGGAFELSEEERLTLTARTLDTAVRTDSDSQFFIRVDLPWGEYLHSGQHRLTPFQFVDAIIRSNLGLCGVNLELSLGYDPPGVGERDLMSVSRLIDLWSLLGIPLHVTLAVPSSFSEDPGATGPYRVADWPECAWSPGKQAQVLADLLALLKSKHSVAGVFLSSFSDRFPHRYPHAGVLDSEGRSKPALEQILAQVR